MCARHLLVCGAVDDCHRHADPADLLVVAHCVHAIEEEGEQGARSAPPEPQEASMGDSSSTPATSAGEPEDPLTTAREAKSSVAAGAKGPAEQHDLLRWYPQVVYEVPPRSLSAAHVARLGSGAAVEARKP
eukprot:CAMPEP_0171126512 /NCGR_PEP_ID=MMETSP0766_2-20121228/113407_1 /TAXON_ID=439317 /ORGANISM="Gambierdiscus australes, Strain CAWD 149" /LENGTH=130 /DNA_ID=CAMNT_0011589563 /DNA_START=115 /DNA_END=503 /DNA_ORIENTATION=+